jgi:hypothetical protein
MMLATVSAVAVLVCAVDRTEHECLIPNHRSIAGRERPMMTAM